MQRTNTHRADQRFEMPSVGAALSTGMVRASDLGRASDLDSDVGGAWFGDVAGKLNVIGKLKGIMRLDMSLRILAAAVIGTLCLGAALWVGAEEASKSDPSQIERQVEQAHNYVERIRAMVQTGFNEREEARNSQNVSRVNCVSEALATLKGMLKIAESMYVAMQECASRKDAGCTESEYVKISITFNKCEELEGQLKGCGGPSIDGAIDGRPVIEKVVEDLPDIKPTQGLTDISPLLENPPSASVFFKMGG